MSDEKTTYISNDDSTPPAVAHGRAVNDPLPGKWTRRGLTFDSFRRRTKADAHNQLNQTLKSRHLNMIAIGGSIGAGLFVGSGGSLSGGGPAALLICFSIIGIMMFNVVFALGELAIVYPISGGFYTYSTRFIDPSWGFAMGWNYVFQWAIVLPLELVVAGLTVSYWGVDFGKDGNAVWVVVFWVAVIIINLFGVLGYAEEEFWVSLLKLITIVIFIIMAFVFVLGGGPDNGEFSTYQGAKTWYNPGAFANGFPGVCGSFVNAAFAFAGTELVGLAAAESKDPQRSLPSAVKQVFWRITLFYILALFFVGLLVPYDDPRLIGSGYIEVKASPFVIASVRAGIPGFANFINAVILCSVLSIGISCVYGGSRTLTALAEQGYAPRLFAYVDRAGRPLPSTLAILLCAPLAFITLRATGEEVFNWLLALSGLAALFTWGSICLAHIRFRKAWKAQGHTLDELPFTSMFGVTGSWLGLSLILVVLIAQFYVAVKNSVEQPEGAYYFFYSYLALFVVMLFYAIGYVWKKKRHPGLRPGWIRLADIDVDSGRRKVDYEALEKYRARRRAWPAWRRVLDKFV